jgi:hypothetical protein
MDRASVNDISKRRLITPLDFLKGREPIPEVRRPGAISKRERELAEASIFSIGLSSRMERAVYVIDHEYADYDFVAKWREDDGRITYRPIQLKEVIPTRINPKASVQVVIDSLNKYTRDLTVAIRVNQDAVLDLDELIIPSNSVAAIWVYGAMAPDGSLWHIVGNLVEPQPHSSCFTYPAGVLVQCPPAPP